jgi:hypothetical protein
MLSGIQVEKEDQSLDIIKAIKDTIGEAIDKDIEDIKKDLLKHA